VQLPGKAPHSGPVKVQSSVVQEELVIWTLRPNSGIPMMTLFVGTPALVIIASAASISVKLTEDRKQSPSGHLELQMFVSKPKL
jgi:hypothetical protein